MKVKKLVSLVISIVMCLSCSLCAHAEVWRLEDCVNTIKSNHRGIVANREQFYSFCSSIDVLLAQYLKKRRVNPSVKLSIVLLRGIGAELREAKELSGDNEREWIQNLSVLQDSFCRLSRSAFDSSPVVLVGTVSGLHRRHSPAAVSSAFVQSTFLVSRRGGSHLDKKRELRNLYLGKHNALNKCIEDLQTSQESLTDDLWLALECKYGDIKPELREAKRYCSSNKKVLIIILSAARDEFLVRAGL